MDSKMKSKTPWRDKLQKEQLLKIVEDPRGRGKMLIPRPIDVDVLIRKIEKGKVVTIDNLRERLAKDCGADLTCPMTTGIFLWIVSETAEEDLRRGEKQITPYWRVIKADGSLNEKFPGGIAAHATYLKEEGHTITAGKGKKPPKVKDFEKALRRL